MLAWQSCRMAVSFLFLPISASEQCLHWKRRSISNKLLLLIYPCFISFAMSCLALTAAIGAQMLLVSLVSGIILNEIEKCTLELIFSIICLTLRKAQADVFKDSKYPIHAGSICVYCLSPTGFLHTCIMRGMNRYLASWESPCSEPGRFLLF